MLAAEFDKIIQTESSAVKFLQTHGLLLPDDTQNDEENAWHDTGNVTPAFDRDLVPVK